jgi:hypothetical protein
VPDHVLAYGRGADSSGGVTILVEVFSQDLFDGKEFEVKISGSSLRSRFLRHVLAWAGGYYALQRLLDSQLMPGDQLCIGSRGRELEGRIENASRDSEAHWAVRCPLPWCRGGFVFRDSRIVLDEPPPSENFERDFTCENGHTFPGTNYVCAYIKAKPPLLLHGTGMGQG